VSGDRGQSTVEKLYRSTLDVTTKRGTRGVTYRSVAGTAGTSVGAIKYHFSNLDELLFRSFAYYVDTMSGRYLDELREAPSHEALIEILLSLTGRRMLADQDDAVLMYSLYAHAARNTEYRVLVRRWMEQTRGALLVHMPESRTIEVEAILEGAILQKTVGEDGPSDDQLRRMFNSVLEAGGVAA